MNPLLVAAVCAITFALFAYTLGVFSERRAGTLKKSHLALFWTGLALDAAGTTLMSALASSAQAASPLHGATGLAAIVLMALHALWASVVLMRGDKSARERFHRLSIGVWLFWLVPYTMGVLMGIPGLQLGDALVCAVSVGIVLCLGLVLHVKANLAHRSR